MRPFQDVTRRDFLETLATGPSLGLLSFSASIAGALPGSQAEPNRKFTPVDLTPHYSTSSADFRLANRPPDVSLDSLRTLAGLNYLRGLPFQFGPGGAGSKDWLAISKAGGADHRAAVEVEIGSRAAFVCLAQFCDWPADTGDGSDPDRFEPVGELLATVSLIFEDGKEEQFPIRRRFEVNTPSIHWGHFCFTAAPGSGAIPKPLDSPLEHGTDWGGLQPGFFDNVYRPPILWLCPLKNPRPDQVIAKISLAAASQETLVICALTLCHLPQHPLRYERLSAYRLTLPDASASDSDRWKIDVDLGVITRRYALPAFDAEGWLNSGWAGLGESKSADPPETPFLCLEIAASAAATLSVSDLKKGSEYRFDLSCLDCSLPGEARSERPRIEVLSKRRVRVRGRIIDEASGRPTPARLSMRSSEGRYLPPFGHRAEINTGWFQDYGADLKIGHSSFAYLDGTFEAELPVGDVFVEISKGFEYQPIRQKLQIRPDTSSIDLTLARWIDLRRKGWATADTHVHFLSPSTALLESQAEGINLVNLLAAQFGELYTNVGDLHVGTLRSGDSEYQVWLGTENRQHVLGHISLLQSHGNPVFPLSTGGPSTSYFGDPLHFTLAECAEACRQGRGLVISPHFPEPPGEIAADIITGRIDAVELWPRGARFGFPFQEWYRYLNCGYRLPAVGGTDKMSAGTPVGANRTYTWLGDRELSFENWAAAVRSGNTFCSTGPLLFLEVEGKLPGSEIHLGSDGGTLEFQVEARSSHPIHRVELVCNGRVVASIQEQYGKDSLVLSDRLAVRGPAWLAGRCWSQLPAGAAWPFALAAHTSPVYVTVPGQELFSVPVAGYLLNLIEGAEAWASVLATREGEEHRRGMLEVFGLAREALERRFHRHGQRL